MLAEKLLGVSKATPDPNFKNVSLLLTGDGTNGAQNNTFLDSSSNNFTITRNGNTTQGTFSPYGNLWSNYFDGNGDYLTVPNNAAFNFGTGDFTIEAWVFIAGDSSLTDGGIRPANIVTAIPSSGTVNGWAFYILGNSTTTGTAVVFENTVSSVPYKVTYTATIPKNTWLNIAVARSGTVTKLFLNGTEVASATLGNQNISNYSNATVIGASTYAGYGSQLNGYLSNVRIVKGTALYTSNFTPSTTPLTAVSGTSLLTCQSSTFVDNSPNNFTITVNGNTSVQRFSPFNPTAPYSASTIGGSGYFDGTGDNLSIPANAALVLTGDFTLEAYIYRTSATSGMLFGSQNGAGSDYVFIGNTEVGLAIAAGGPAYPSFAVTMPVYAWTHVAVTRQSGVIKVFVNGVQAGSNVTNAATMFQSVPFLIGRYGYDSNPYWFNGYISNARIVKGTALYTSNFTPPTAPLTPITNTSLLCNFTNAGIPDAAMMNDLETVGNAQVSTSVKKYGTGSLYFDGTGDYLVSPTNSTVLALGGGDFTVEGWIYPTTIPPVASTAIVDFRASSSDTTGFFFGFISSGALQIYSQGVINTTGGTVSTNIWSHVALVRSNGTIKIYLNGTSVATVSNNTNWSQTRVIVGNDPAGINPFNGYIDDLRITKGYARYTANFTPPTAALPVY